MPKGKGWDIRSHMEPKDKKEILKFGGHIEPDKTKDLGHGVVEVVVSTPSLDYHGESVNLDGINVKEYHGTVLYGHDYEGLPIGKAVKVWKDKASSSLKARVQFAVEEYPFAKTVYDMIKGGYLTDVSIGGLVSKWNDDWTVIEEMIMKEFSVVPIGANNDARIVAMSIGKSIEDISAEYNSAVQKHFADSVKGLPKQQINDSIEAIKTLLAALEGSAGDLSADTATPTRRVKLITMRQQARELDRHSETIIRTINVTLKRKGNQ